MKTGALGLACILLTLAAMAGPVRPVGGSASTGPSAHVECVDGFAGAYPCSAVDLMHQLALSEIGGGSGSDIWGWTDPVTGSEYAIMTRSSGTAFIDITDPESPVYVGNLPTQTVASDWRDAKVVNDHAVIVSEAPGHGLQIFDLSLLRGVTTPPAAFTATAHFGSFGSAHNVVVDDTTDVVFAVGTELCSGGLYMLDLSTPTSPSFLGCFSGDGYTHDAQCVVYAGPDADHVGQEICFCSNEDAVAIVDVTDKAAPVMLSSTSYSGVAYTHQGWLTEDQKWFLLGDEIDEINLGHPTRTRVWDVSDLDAPFVDFSWDSSLLATDHNLYVRGNYCYQANYRAGLRILDISDLASGNVSEVAFFDIVPGSDAAGTSGAWSVYPYYESGHVVISGIGEGFFVVKPDLCDQEPPATTQAAASGPSQVDVSWTDPQAPPGATWSVQRGLGPCPGVQFETIAAGLTASPFSDVNASGDVDLAYVVFGTDAGLSCSSPPGPCSSATTTGPCTAPPRFVGLTAVVDSMESACALDLSWSTADPSCGGPVTYSVFRSLDEAFTPAPENLVAQGLNGTTWRDSGATSGAVWHYVVRATDTSNLASDRNLNRRSGSVTGPPNVETWQSGAEVGDPGMSTGTGTEHVGWEISSSRAQAGARSWFSGSTNNTCVNLRTPALSLDPDGAPQLSFWSVWDVEPGWDGGQVQARVDGGPWAALSLTSGHPGTFIDSDDACSFGTGEPAFTGTNLTWTRHDADLSGWAGSEVEIRWVYSTDQFVTEEGWYIDEVAVTDVLIPGPCGLSFFQDGFESGDTSAWSSVSP